MGAYLKIEEADGGTAYLLTYRNESGTGITKAYGSLDRAMTFAKSITKSELTSVTPRYGTSYWYTENL